jgi:hypothetical protein
MNGRLTPHCRIDGEKDQHPSISERLSERIRVEGCESALTVGDEIAIGNRVAHEKRLEAQPQIAVVVVQLSDGCLQRVYRFAWGSRQRCSDAEIDCHQRALHRCIAQSERSLENRDSVRILGGDCSSSEVV